MIGAKHRPEQIKHVPTDWSVSQATSLILKDRMWLHPDNTAELLVHHVDCVYLLTVYSVWFDARSPPFKPT